MMEEIWKDIEGYEGIYQVSNLGRVKRLDYYLYKTNPKNGAPMKHLYRGHIKKPSIRVGGYRVLSLYKDGISRNFKLHRLVAKAFVLGYFEGAHINHIDENPANNRADNLEWCTPAYNEGYGSHGANISAAKAKTGRVVEHLSPDGKVIATYPHSTAASKATGIANSTIRKWCNTATNNLWRYKE